MQTRPTPAIPKHSSNKKYTQKPRIHSYSQHGAQQQSSSHLLSLPEESLTHVTAYLDPPTLYRLALACRRLRDHVAQDTVWHRAFLWAYLGIGPEDGEDGDATVELMLRRRENTWKKEYVSRWMLIRRIQHSRNATVTHVPTHSAVSSHLYFPTTQSLLSASLVYGIVARSLPLTGRVLKGYLDANGTFNGLGIGNPNAEFSIEVSCIELGKEGDAQEGGTGRILWGFRNGDVAVTRGVKPSEVGRAARLTRSASADAHKQRVEALAMGQSGTIVSAGADGRVKIWDGVGTGHALRCLWASATAASGSVIGPLCKVEFSNGFVVAASTGGQILLWHGVDVAALLVARDVPDGRRPEVINPPIPSIPAGTQANGVQPNLEPTTLLLNAVSRDMAYILVHYGDADHFWRLRVSVTPSVHGLALGKVDVQRTKFSGGPVGSITSLTASFAPTTLSSSSTAPSPMLPSPSPEPAEQTIFEMSDIPSRVHTLQVDIDAYALVRTSKARSFVVSGDTLGRVCLWDWEADGVLPTQQDDQPRRAYSDVYVVESWRKWEAHDDGSLTALKLRAGLLVTGSSQGSVKVWDPLPPFPAPQPLRTLPSPSPKPQPGHSWEGVTHVSLEDDVVVASVGSRVIAWRGGNLGRDKPGKGKGRGKGSSRVVSAKYAQQIEMERDIRDSRREVQAEQQVFHSKIVREREQLDRLDQLGLDEIGGLEYALMLSREEEEKRILDALRTSDDDLTWQDAPSSSRIARNEEGDTSLDFSPPASRDSSYSQSHFVTGSWMPSTSPGMARYLSSSAHSSSSFLSSPRLPASFSNTKVQISPLLRPEPTHAGASFTPDLSISPPNFSLESHIRTNSVSTTPINFPSLPPSSRASSQSSPQLSPVDGVTPLQYANRSLGNEKSRLKGWNMAARSLPSGPPVNSSPPIGETPTTQFVAQPIKPVQIQSPGRTSLLSAQLASLSPRDAPRNLEDEEEMLKYVMELSLAEARSAGLEV